MKRTVQLKEYLNNAKEIGLEERKISSMIKDIEKKYPLEKDIYIEVAKYYLGKDDKESIKYLEKYVLKGGENEEVKLLLVKLYKQDMQLDKAKEIINRLKKTEEVIIESLRIAIELKDKSWIKEIDKDIRENDIEIEKKEIEEICRIYEGDKEYEGEKYYIERYKDKYDLSEIKCRYYENSGNIEQALKELIKEIDIEENKKEIVRIINENVEGYIKEVKDVKWIIEELCKQIEEDDTNSDIIQALSLILRMREIKGEERRDIVELLMRYSKKSMKARASNIFLNEAEILEKKIILKSKPRQLVVSLTTKCNLKCVMCGLHKEYHTISEECFEYIKSIIPYLERVKWQGGEVFLYEKFEELLNECINNKVPQFIQTNGLLLNDKFLNKCLKNNIWLSFSIDAVNKQTYEQIRLGAKFNNLIEKLELIKKYKQNNKNFKYSMLMVVMSLNYKQILDAVSFAIEYGFSAISFQQYVPYVNKELALNRKQAEEVVEQIKILKQKSLNNSIPIEILTDISLNEIFVDTKLKEKQIFNDNYTSIKDLKVPKISGSNLFCVSPWMSIFLDTKYKMRFCCPSMFIDVKEYDYNNIWNCEQVKIFRNKIKNDLLPDCYKSCQYSNDDVKNYRFGLMWYKWQ